MSMIYECPSCHTPQAAGQTSCNHCGADFEGPVPDDAVVPEPAAVECRGRNRAAQGLNRRCPSLPPPPEALPYQPPPLPAYQPPPEYAAPPVYQTAPPALQTRRGLPKALLIGIPIVLVLVLGAVLFTRNLDQGSETPLQRRLAVAAPTRRPFPRPLRLQRRSAPPVTLPGGGTASADNTGPAKFLVGTLAGQDKRLLCLQ